MSEMIMPTIAKGNEYLNGTLRKAETETPEKRVSLPTANQVYEILIEKTDAFRIAGYYRKKGIKFTSRFGKNRFRRQLQEMVEKYFSGQTSDPENIGTITVKNTSFSVKLDLIGQRAVAETITVSTIAAPPQIATSLVGCNELLGTMPHREEGRLEGVLYEFDLTFERN
ncbi:hypothetical protein KY310_01905 [Candidatus Woesearchaeota archaeon]|nr:hypothetical protein [Candidatus Woesearchaeota archaeon]